MKRIFNTAAFFYMILAFQAKAAVFYVNVSNTGPVTPYATWATAATNIQTAIDAASPGDLVWVTNGVYKTGGRPIYGSYSNRVALTKALTVQSVNGAGVTTIQGQQIAATTNGTGAIRCAYLANGAVLNGFTLANGATWTSGDVSQDESGGGVWCAGTNALVYNCIFSGNAANYYGGGAYSGTLSNCQFVANTCAYIGGGACSNVLLNCAFTRNVAGYGGGAGYGIFLANCGFTNNTASVNGGGIIIGTLTNCVFTGNLANSGGGVELVTMSGGNLTGNFALTYGGGAANSTLTNCTLSGNSAVTYGGGIDGGLLVNCTVTGNAATNGGAAFAISAFNCVFSGNTATNRGGALYGGAYTNCLVTGNTAPWGGGLYSATLNNCTVTANTATIGGGAFSGTFNNCIVYYNAAPVGPNYASSTFSYSCTTPAYAGPGNLAQPPALADAFRLSGTSPCIGAGLAGSATGTDLLGEPWASPPSMGCAEYYPAAATGGLGVQILALYTNTTVGFPLNLTGVITGAANSNYWNFGDGTGQANSPYATHAWHAAGSYAVVFQAFNASNSNGISATQVVQVATQAVYYVRTNTSVPVAPYNSWATAATNIQDAINAVTAPGALVVVSNGVYATRSTVVYGALANRVAVTMPLVLQSLNGPGVTTIQGFRSGGTGTGNSAVRGVYLADGATLSGFTLTLGATRAAGDLYREQSGGGLWCATTAATVTNCVISGNIAGYLGGGSFSGTLTNCTVSANIGGYGGGGAMGSVVNNCTLTGNWATNGGGVYLGTVNGGVLSGNTATNGGGASITTLTGSLLSGNFAIYGGGANAGSLVNCGLTNNSAGTYGGGVNNAGLTNCTLTANTAPNGGGAYNSGLTNCTVWLNHAVADGGGAYDGTLDNCLVISNTAGTWGAGVYTATLANCTLTGNSGAVLGGGAYGGTLNNCTLARNSAVNGGGAYSAALTNCLINSNSVTGGGGGAGSCTVVNCGLTNNTAGYGGGAGGGTILNCTLTGNSATTVGGGTDGGTFTNCLFLNNSCATYGGGEYTATLYNCVLTGNQAGGGGGACGGTLYNCALTGNTAITNGGGSLSSTLNNCTLTGNSALTGGGVDTATLNNCLVYYNSAGTGPNFNGGTFNYCCTTPSPGSGNGNITAAPLLSDPYHLSAQSPCRGAGSTNYASGLDIDGLPWGNPPDIGCAGYTTNLAGGAFPLSITLQADHTNAAVGYTLNFGAIITGVATSNAWTFGDGSGAIYQPYVSHAWTTPGTYAVVFRAYNGSYPGGISATVTVQVVSQPVYYVAAANLHPVAPYTSWATAATNLQDAVNAVTVPGALVLVTNGVYAHGGQVVFGAMSNRVAVTTPLSLQSLNGPGVTVIAGNQVAGTTNGDSAVRGVYLTNGSSMFGFTVTNGATRAAGDLNQEQSGAGIWCAASTVVVSNCVLAGNVAIANGGGLYSGTVLNSQFSANAANLGGGTYYSAMTNCTLTGNAATTSGGGAYAGNLAGCALTGNSAAASGGGASLGTLAGCTLTANSSGNGGGADTAALANCTLTNNTASNAGGAAYYGSLTNCLILANSATNYAGGVYYATLNQCLLISNLTTVSYGIGGGVYDGNLTNCVFIGNSAWEGGGAIGGTQGAIAGADALVLVNCAFTNNVGGVIGGGVGGGMGGSVTVYNSIFVGNTALTGSGGGAVNGVFTNCLFRGNIAASGGGISGSTLYNCQLMQNTATNGGGANGGTLYNCAVTGNTAVTGGGAYGCNEYNCTLAGNSAGDSGGDYNGTLYNCIVYDNAASTNPNYSGSTLTSCCTVPAAPVGGANLTNDPAFVNPAAGNFHLQTNSPCINSGNNADVTGSTDLDGNPRIAGGTVDLGAYEYQTPVSRISYAWLQQYGIPINAATDISDFDGDGMNNWQEWIAGTNPTNAASVFKFTGILPGVGGNTVSWLSVTTVTYYLQRTTNLASPAAYASIQSNIVGQPVQTSYLDTNAVGRGPLFYRVAVQQ